MFRYLITGGAGFLGKYVSQETGGFVSDNCEKNCGSESSLPYEVYYLDVTDADSVFEIIEDLQITHVLHLAAYGRNLSCRDFEARAREVNVNGTRNVLEAARRAETKPRVIVCSSNIVLSDQPTVYKETKMAAEDLVRWYADFYGVSCMALRPSNIYGEGQSRTEYQPCAFAGLDINFEKTGKFQITGDGTQSRDFVHAADVARAFHLAARSSVVGLTIDICTGIQTSMNEVAALLKVPVEYTDPRPGDAKTLVSDPSQAKALLDFEARIALKDRIFDAFPAVSRATSHPDIEL